MRKGESPLDKLRAHNRELQRDEFPHMATRRKQIAEGKAMTEEELKAIERRLTTPALHGFIVRDDVPALIAEVRRLRGLLPVSLVDATPTVVGKIERLRAMIAEGLVSPEDLRKALTPAPPPGTE